MNVDGKQTRPIRFDETLALPMVIDQRKLPHQLIEIPLDTVEKVIEAIGEMFVRGAPLIGATGAFGVYTALVEAPDKSGDDVHLTNQCRRIKESRPTAVNLAWGVDRVLSRVLSCTGHEARYRAARAEALAVVEEEAENCRRIGRHGLNLIKEIQARKKKNGPFHILTHCNAGWLATVEYGTATAPMYTAFDAGMDIHVWVDETRPLNQGARLTAWELGKHGIPHTVVTDNAGGHLMQHGLVDLVLVGTDRTTRTGDVANKIGTYLKALAARDNAIPFYVALPSSTFDWALKDGLEEIPIETRDPGEIHNIQGLSPDGAPSSVRITPADSPALNPAFDVTPARLVTGFITERGMCEASEEAILSLFPEQA